MSELARPGEQFDVPEDVDPVVEPCERQGYVRVTYLKPVTAVPIEDDADPAYLR